MGHCAVSLSGSTRAYRCRRRCRPIGLYARLISHLLHSYTMNYNYSYLNTSLLDELQLMEICVTLCLEYSQDQQ